MGQLQQVALGDPLQISLVALLQGSGKAVGGEQVHILRGPPVGDKGDDPPVSVVGEGKPGLLPGLPEQTVLRALPVLELAPDPDPLVLVQIVLLLDPVEHQVLLSPADIAQRGIDHVRPPLGRSPAWPLPGCTWG